MGCWLANLCQITTPGGLLLWPPPSGDYHSYDMERTVGMITTRGRSFSSLSLPSNSELFFCKKNKRNYLEMLCKSESSTSSELGALLGVYQHSTEWHLVDIKVSCCHRHRPLVIRTLSITAVGSAAAAAAARWAAKRKFIRMQIKVL